MGKRKQKHNIKQEEQLIEKSTQQRCSADHKSRSTDDEEDATLLDQPAKKLRASATCKRKGRNSLKNMLWRKGIKAKRGVRDRGRKGIKSKRGVRDMGKGSILRRCSEQQSGSATVDNFLDQPVEGVRGSVQVVWGQRGIWWSSSNYYRHFTMFEERPFQHGCTRGLCHKLR
ncbi:hypothetical protein POM88_015513 [Heracleum sosnowskyi]|uniref:Uncharacterized protein n=1 Tax=Heracleum sosnowskyi TaxID=360622 RepID=A0AAD8IKE5_9APIA|nr:hypothetical protein POM88_015513 [Heracleum sosnowskyi]